MPNEMSFEELGRKVTSEVEAETNELTMQEIAEDLEEMSNWEISHRKIQVCKSAASIIRKVSNGEYAPVVHGWWIKRPFPHIGGELKCSRCNGIFGAELYRHDYCPSCGARLDGKDDSHETD